MTSLMGQPTKTRCPTHLQTSVTRSGELSPLWQKFKSLWQFSSFRLVFGKILNLLLQFFREIGQILYVVKWQNVDKNNLAIWSHCCRLLMATSFLSLASKSFLRVPALHIVQLCSLQLKVNICFH